MALLRGYTTGYHASSSYQVASLPSGIQAGDLLVIAIGDRYLPSLPVGWTSKIYGSGTNQSGRVGYKIADGTDVGTGTVTYVCSGTGTGAYATLAFEAGTFDASDPIAAIVQSTYYDINESTGFVAINAGQTAYHFANGRTSSPGTVVAAERTLLERREADPDSESALYANIVLSDTTTNITWTATEATTGSYKATFVVRDPAGTTTLPGLSGEASLLVAVYDVAPISPKPDDILLTTAPELIVIADGTPTPFQVTFQTSDTAGFGSVLWEQTLTNQYPGIVQTTVGTALTPNVTSYWRARAGDGTSWGPWIDAQALNPLLERTNGQEYMHVNVGAELAVVADTGEYLHENVGFEQILVDDGQEYMHENVGFEEALDHRGGEYMHENVFIGTPVPHLWFAYLAYGFPNDHIYVWGQGLGTLQTEYNAIMRIHDVNTDTDTNLTIFDWSVNPAGADAYTAARQIFAGSGEASPPVVTQEADVVEVIIPTGVATETAVIDLIFAVTTGGESNRIEFLLYPQIPWDMAVSDVASRGLSSVRLVPDKSAADPVPLLYAAYTVQPVVIGYGMLEDVPDHLVSTSSTFTFDSGSSSADLEDPVGTPVPLGARWRPLTASVVSHPEIGTGVSLWEPLSGSENYWRIDNGTDPYVDEAYVVATRNGDLVRPAMIFPGDAWCYTTDPVPAVSSRASFTFYAVVTISANQTENGNTDGVVLSSYVPGGQPGGTYPFSLVLDDAYLRLNIGIVSNWNLRALIPQGYLGARPVIVMLTIAPDPDDTAATPALIGSLSVLSDRLRRASATIQEVADTSQLWLGRDDVAGEESRIVVYDAGLGSALTAAQEAALLSDLDGAYGVSEA